MCAINWYVFAGSIGKPEKWKEWDGIVVAHAYGSKPAMPLVTSIHSGKQAKKLGVRCNEG